MKKQTRAQRRFERQRQIKRKLNILRYRWLNFDEMDIIEGKFAKGKVHCSCKYCRYEQYFHVPKRRDLSQKLLMDNDEREYFCE